MFRLLTPANRVTIGADPEVFIINQSKLVFPACGLIGGTKENPIKVDKGALQEDNVMAEFNIDPAHTVEEFVTNINTVYSELVCRISRQGLLVDNTMASAEFPLFLLNKYPQAKEFGCTPDFNGYTLQENESPDPNNTLRTCAGHVHLGFNVEVNDEEYMNMCGSVVGYLDWIVGLWTVIEDSDTVRRERYGKAGAFRPKPYGLEYRVPSNFWLRTDTLKRTMFNRIRIAYGLAAGAADKPSDNEVINAINTHDKAACAKLLGGYAA